MIHIMKIVKSVEGPGLLVKAAIQKTANKIIEKEVDFLVCY